MWQITVKTLPAVALMLGLIAGTARPVFAAATDSPAGPQAGAPQDPVGAARTGQQFASGRNPSGAQPASDSASPHAVAGLAPVVQQAPTFDFDDEPESISRGSEP
jgi:hypothetical protein